MANVEGDVGGVDFSPSADAPPASDRRLRLDPIHIRILQILERDGRTSVSSIAREVGLTDNAVRYRLRKLHHAGVVRRVTVHVDPARLGRSRTCIALLRLGPKADLQRIAAHPCVALLLPTQGTYQAVVVFTARDSAELLDLQDVMRGEPGVLESTVLDVAPGADVPVLPSACLGRVPPRTG